MSKLLSNIELDSENVVEDYGTELPVQLQSYIHPSEDSIVQSIKNLPIDLEKLIDVLEDSVKKNLKGVIFQASIGQGKILSVTDPSITAKVPLLDLTKGPVFVKEGNDVYINDMVAPLIKNNVVVPKSYPLKTFLSKLEKIKKYTGLNKNLPFPRAILMVHASDPTFGAYFSQVLDHPDEQFVYDWDDSLFTKDNLVKAGIVRITLAEKKAIRANKKNGNGNNPPSQPAQNSSGS